MRLALTIAATALVAAACRPAPPAPSTAASVLDLLAPLADDSLQGRMTGEPGATRAATMIAETMRRIGLVPAGDSGFLQPVPIAVVPPPPDRPRPRRVLLESFAAGDTVAPDRRRTGYNVLGVLQGRDDADGEYVLVDAHYDHVGIGPAVDGDSIYNGADDDASGVVAVLEIARQLAAGPKPRRTILFATTTGEEVGLLGTRWYIAHPWRPLEQMVANLEIEMIGRPDSLAGGPGRGWLTGYDRSTMGDELAAQGIPIVADPRPDQHFFERSDNIAFARLGIVAHTLSSFGLHTDYHRPSDDVSKVDADHMAKVINAAAQAVRLLADGPAPTWKPDGRPEPRTP